ncbi:helicase-exonuclease AddAB subunit AddA [Fictibacillus macauensis]|nr:helicase-exonuclease AddAB subunit AddA [Fictibacillus macauensis]
MPEKPTGSQWTDDQWKAIQTHGEDILVAAAAGSGKTAVLVERIITMIRNEQADVDRLLIVTFTNAAAAEMRKRIGEAIEKELHQRPASLHLRRQLSLLNKASISTLHSFCIEVLRKYYYLIDLDPSFRIANETEVELIRQEVLEELFEEHYGKENNEAFIALVDAYTSDRNDLDLQELVLKLYDFSRSHPAPDRWLLEMAAQYNVPNQTIDELPWTKELLHDTVTVLEGARQALQRGLQVTSLPGGPQPYAQTLQEDQAYVEALLNGAQQSWDHLYNAFQSGGFQTIKQARGKEIDAVLKEQVKRMRDSVKKKVTDLKEELFSRNPVSYMLHIEEMAPIITSLVSLVQQFSERFLKEKQERGLVDFSDLEHFCLEVLMAPDSTIEHPQPTEAALDYQSRFVEVLVDEYQDTNLVQETLVKLVSKRTSEQKNLFMVGDVKQSIYRFRLAEPGLFLAKYKAFSKADQGNGVRIDLSKNFRSRQEVLHATNFIFKQVMNEEVGEIQYDEAAALDFGATYYPTSAHQEAEVLLINKATTVYNDDGEDTGETEKSDHETVILEARVMAERIKQMIGKEHEPHMIFDSKRGEMRPVQYKDIVILMRATSAWAPVIMEEFKRQGIPTYAELSSGYFEAVEVGVMLSLLKMIDNPLQDIPVASVLRSPIVGLNGEEMAAVRLAQQKSSYFEAMNAYCDLHPDDDLTKKLAYFLRMLKGFRAAAREGSLADLIWQIYRETGYFDFVGGLPGGKQRQANLRALYDRANQYETTSFRGLFRFLRFIERMQDKGKDLGAARALGEQEDVVRIMTIHKSKGLEFPVVFVAGLNKKFNTQDLSQSVLLHKELGLGTKYINPKLRISYPTIMQLAISRRMKMELLAEEMRVLYVALTRAKEKLVLVGTFDHVAKTVAQWAESIDQEEWLLPAYERMQAKSYFDWIGRAVIRHRDSNALHQLLDFPVHGRGEVYVDASKWQIKTLEASHYDEDGSQEQARQEERLAAIARYEEVDEQSPHKETIESILNWRYAHHDATVTMSKQSVSELKKQYQPNDEYSGQVLAKSFRSELAERPKFMQAKQMTAAERGTAMHLVMQHLPLQQAMTEERLKEWLLHMVERELLTSEQAATIDVTAIMTFLQTGIGKRLQQGTVMRELPFSLGISAQEAFAHWKGNATERVLIQGVIDCLLVEEDGYVLIDYKSDGITGRFIDGFEGAKDTLLQRYRVQLHLYSIAIERILGKPVKACFLYFFDGGHLVEVKKEKGGMIDETSSYR